MNIIPAEQVPAGTCAKSWCDGHRRAYADGHRGVIDEIELSDSVTTLTVVVAQYGDDGPVVVEILHPGDAVVATLSVVEARRVSGVVALAVKLAVPDADGFLRDLSDESPGGVVVPLGPGLSGPGGPLRPNRTEIN